jgi:hypothetical protein
MHLLEEGVDIKGIYRVFHDYGNVLGYKGLGYKAQVIELMKQNKAFEFLEVRHGLLFMILEARNHIDSRILLTFHQLRSEKFHKPSNNIRKMTTRKV